MNKKNNKIIPKNTCSIRADLSQIVGYDNPEFPVSLQQITFPESAPYTVTDHWHDEFEFIYVKEGVITYMVEGESITLNKGQGIFVNTRKIHVVKPKDDEVARFYCIILHPMLLSASIYVDRMFIEPLIQSQQMTYVLLNEEIQWQKNILQSLEKMYICYKEENGEGSPLMVQMYFFKVWNELYTHFEHREVRQVRPNHNLSILKEMISYIHQHYNEKISLGDIAAAGSVGKTMCISIFNRYVNKTPGEFLKEYRIHQSTLLLKNTDMSVTDICYESGFASASYFTRIFRETMGITPLEFREVSV